MLDECFQDLLDIYFASEPEGGLKGRIWRTLNPEDTPRKISPITLFMKEMLRVEKDYGDEKNKKSLARQRERYKSELQRERDLLVSAKKINEELLSTLEEYEASSIEQQKLYTHYLAEDLKEVIQALQAGRNIEIKPEKLKSFCLKNNVEHLGHEGI